MSIRLAIRGYFGRERKFEEFLDEPLLQLDEALPDIADRHLLEMAAGRLTMIEVEFLDEADQNQRFLRFGTRPDGMVCPILFDLSEI